MEVASADRRLCYARTCPGICNVHIALQHDKTAHPQEKNDSRRKLSQKLHWKIKSFFAQNTQAKWSVGKKVMAAIAHTAVEDMV